jgi:hypothetical protein
MQKQQALYRNAEAAGATVMQTQQVLHYKAEIEGATL